MTNKEFFIKTLETEAPVFIKVLKALPKDKGDYKPGKKARTLSSIAIQLAMQPVMISKVIKTGLIDFSKQYEPSELDIAKLPDALQKNFGQLKKDLKDISDENWEADKAKMVWQGGEWSTPKYEMAWMFLFDAIHHRGQLSTYLRAVGGKVPGIYGGSADEPV